MNVLNNAWIVGIGTGILSGLLVYWLLSLFLSKKKDREYQQQISGANKEVIYSIRSGIPENSLPTRDVVEALIHSTARRYYVQAAELYQPKEITEELIKEVMDSSFLSSAKKVEYCAALLPLGQKKPDMVLRMGSTQDTDMEILNIRTEVRSANLVKEARNTFVLSFVIGVLTALASGLFVVQKLFPSVETKIHLVGKSVGLAVVISLTVAAIVPLLFDSAKILNDLIAARARLKHRDVIGDDDKDIRT
jgi:hypothetical protein